jgi:hypothetical protein
MFDDRKLKRLRLKTSRDYAKRREELKQQKAAPVEFQELDFEEFTDIQEIEEEIDQRASSRLFDRARTLDVETPTLAEKEMWERSFFGRGAEGTSRAWLSSKGRSAVRRRIDEEKTRRFEVKTLWVTKFWIPLFAALIGIIGALTGLVAVLHLQRV